MSNLPNWPGASAAYSRAYRIMSNMARKGYVTPPIIGKRGRVLKSGHISQEMEDYVKALNSGDEETIKGLNLQYLDYDLPR